MPSDIYTEGIRRISPVDFGYAHMLRHTIRLVCVARQTPEGLLLSVRPSLIPQSTILASVRGILQRRLGTRKIWRGYFLLWPWRGSASDRRRCGQRSDARGPRDPVGQPGASFALRARPPGEYCPIPIALNRAAYYLRFRVKDRPGIIAQLAAALAAENISIEAVLQLPDENAHNLPFVITAEPSDEASIRAALARMQQLDFFIEPPLAMPIETSL